MNIYITELKRSQIRLRDWDDELIWDLAPSGIYTPKEGYTHCRRLKSAT
jgi:hypothetical protein